MHTNTDSVVKEIEILKIGRFISNDYNYETNSISDTATNLYKTIRLKLHRKIQVPYDIPILWLIFILS